MFRCADYKPAEFVSRYNKMPTLKIKTITNRELACTYE